MLRKLLLSTLLSGSIYHCIGQSNDLLQPATASETAAFNQQYKGQPFLLFPETREHPIRLLDSLPVAWLHAHPEQLPVLKATAQPGEFFVFQVGVYAHKTSLEQVAVRFSKMEGHPVIAPDSFQCFNTSGTGYNGKGYTTIVNVPTGRIQPLWIGVQLPVNATGSYRTPVTITAKGKAPQVMMLELTIDGAVLKDGGVDDAWRLARLKWLNSKVGADNRVTNGYAPVKNENGTLYITGRSVQLNNHGLPAAINTYFAGANDVITTTPSALLAGDMKLVITTADGNDIALQPGSLRMLAATPAGTQWEVSCSGKGITVLCKGSLEADGWGNYSMEVTTNKNITIKDIRLEVPLKKERAAYAMGLNHEGGYRPDTIDWKWDTATRQQDALWIGDVNGGVRIKLKAENYKRPLVNIYYPFGPLQSPPSWWNNGAGGVTVWEKTGTVLFTAYSGARTLQAGHPLFFDFEMLITPVKQYSKKVQYGDRYYHSDSDVSADYLPAAKAVGANIINIHHKKDIYPYINYPYLAESVPDLQSFITKAHAQGERVKPYYTTRELTVNLPEFWAFRSLGGSIIFPGPGKAARTVIHQNGPPAWLINNVKENFIPAWVATFTKGKYKGHEDYSVITTPDSRLNNFYLAGLDWMVKKLEIDGVYIDDCAMDRLTLKRARKILDDNRPAARIDLHSWNHFDSRAGWASCLNVYMDLLPYIDQVWIGEGRNYNRAPDHWLIEVSGIPFGLPSQMLEGGGNPWRGMIYGITNRAGWTRDQSQWHLWQFFDQYDLLHKQMIGYWDPQSPATTDNDQVKVTVYKGNQQAVIAIANWSGTAATCRLLLDPEKLGFNPATATISMPAIPAFQEEGHPASLQQLEVPGGKGMLIVVDKK
ncbi:hypothetical protein CLV51_1011618 [Chitinophaga niastensis]|uniref:Glycoside hydrolase 123-like N-terminal domain-containing protein n=1 Tax=Chitinophaga niastensis TaxID=536980 RepID=A0A2P8HVT3_CHINA|nr:glycoside hydrolase domain-containing protein [Chitinophaga niastensis]PSL50274.1 hypothetical protein CLV51_1011618 [Chitinophaga niastensis]